MAGTRSTRKKKMEGGKRKKNAVNSTIGGGKRKKNPVNSTMGGGKRKASPWNKFVKKVFTDLRRKDKDATFGDALKWASKHKSEM